MYAAERQALLIDRLQRDGRVSVVAVADELGVSGETVRRDLAVLERDGIALRVHGGAVLARSIAGETALAQRTSEHQAQKAQIAKAALELVPANGGSVAFDAGTTVEQLVDLLPTDLTVTALTHAVPIAGKLLASPAIDLHVVGGRVRGITGAAVGHQALEAYRDTRVDIAFVGTNGISRHHGFSTHDSEEAAVKRALVSSARRVVVLSDASKLGREPVFTFATLPEVDVLVTDTSASDEDLAPVREAGIEVILA